MIHLASPTVSLLNRNNHFHLKICLFCLIFKNCGRTDMCENNDHYWLWLRVGQVDHNSQLNWRKSFLPLPPLSSFQFPVSSHFLPEFEPRFEPTIRGWRDGIWAGLRPSERQINTILANLRWPTRLQPRDGNYFTRFFGGGRTDGRMDTMSEKNYHLLVRLQDKNTSFAISMWPTRYAPYSIVTWPPIRTGPGGSIQVSEFNLYNTAVITYFGCGRGRTDGLIKTND